MQDDLEERIRRRAYALWEQEGCPAGRENDHWEKARILVAIEDDRTSLKSVEAPRPEEAELQKNLGEFPGALTDQGDEQQFPSRELGPAPRKQSSSRRKR
jgi:hypothetical protein